ncbi:MAG TPA: PAS domain-containing protein [Usitatibacter sp.]|nr:PAS domain-containing protein [Usitatibacter sp.]
MPGTEECVKVLDLEGHLVSISEAGCRLLEIDDPDSVIGRSWIDLWSGPDLLKAKAAVKAASRGETVVFEGFGHTMKGRGRHWRTRLSPINGSDGAPRQLLVVSRDVTEEKGR